MPAIHMVIPSLNHESIENGSLECTFILVVHWFMSKLNPEQLLFALLLFDVRPGIIILERKRIALV
jgi:hypothetical protein